MDKEYAIRCIEDYAGEYIIDRRKKMPKGYFELWSYRNAAIKEIIYQIKHTDDDVVDTIQSFVDHTLLYSRKSRKPSNKRMFSIMHEMGENILDFFHAMERSDNHD